MRFRSLARSCAAGAALALAALSTTALAHGDQHHTGEERGGPDMRPEWKGDRQQGFDPRIREWLGDCRRRISDRGATFDRLDRSHGRDACEAYLDNYHARYASGDHGYGYGYAQPMIMVPVMVPSQEPCVETVTTEYVDRPARRIIRRPAPRSDKRIRVAPDKRIPL